MEHPSPAARGRRSVIFIRIAVCFFVLLAIIAVTSTPPTEARIPPGAQGTPSITLSAKSAAIAPPSPLPGQTTVDSHTVALYHFDAPYSAAIDETGRYPGTFVGGATVTDVGLYRGALSLPGPSSYVGTGNLPALSQGTLEAFIDFQPVCQTAAESFSIISARDANSSNIIMQLRVTVGLKFGIYSAGKWNWVDSGINPCRYLSNGPSAPGWPYDTWRFHHVAGTWGPRGLEIWVDGILHGLGTDDPNAAIWPYKYMCNPQMQLGVSPAPPNPLYPVCQTPVMAPIGGYPPGDYMGGIPSASLTVGCGSDSCFVGRLDELRISDIQRTFSTSIVPTSTPLPTATPVNLKGEYTPNSITVGLYHLAEDVWFGSGHFTKDAQNNQWDAGLEGNAALTSSGRYGSGMLLDGTTNTARGSPTFLRMNATLVHVGSVGTFEAWVNLAPDSPDASPFFVAGNEGDDMYFGLYPPGRVMFRIYNGNGYVSNETQISKSELVGSWHHLAASWGSRGLQVWLDGVLRNTVSFNGAFFTPTQYLAAGCDRAGHCMKGVVDEVRLSNEQISYVPIATPTALFSVLPASVATTTVQPSSPGVTIIGNTLFDGIINPNYRGSSKPNESLPTGPLAAVSSGLTPASAPAAAIATPPLPVAENTLQSIASSPPLKTNSLSVDQPLALDVNAIALYRLNSQYGITLSDATGNNSAVLFGDATIKSRGEERPALLLNGGLSYAQATHFKTPRNGTVEVWANFQSNPGQMTILAARQNNAPRFLLGVRADENLSLGFGVYQGGWQWADSGLTLRALGSGWHHLAGTWGPRGVEIWIDGNLRGVNPYANGLVEDEDDTLLIGWSPGSAGMYGQISQIRISNTQRSY